MYEARVGPGGRGAPFRMRAPTSSSTPRARGTRRLLEPAARRAPPQGAAGADGQSDEGPVPPGCEDHRQRAADALPGPRHAAREVRPVQVADAMSGFV